MNNTNTGGPAFPHTVEYKGADCGGVVPHGGMTLRDYFAAQALQGAISHGLFNSQKTEKSYAEYLAAISYVYADAMLKAREA
jgi:hypothetical protein